MQIIIDTGYDFTPVGKRSARLVQTRRGHQLRWYVGGRLYVKGADLTLTNEWLNNAGADNHFPQPWFVFEGN